MKVEVFKRTTDNWYPSYNLNNDYDNKSMLVEVSFIELSFEDDIYWRVCVWGGDDCGMEMDYPKHKESECWNMFLQVIGLDYVNMNNLKELGFYSA